MDIITIFIIRWELCIQGSHYSDGHKQAMREAAIGRLHSAGLHIVPMPQLYTHMLHACCMCAYHFSDAVCAQIGIIASVF